MTNTPPKTSPTNDRQNDDKHQKDVAEYRDRSPEIPRKEIIAIDDRVVHRTPGSEEEEPDREVDAHQDRTFAADCVPPLLRSLVSEEVGGKKKRDAR